MKLIRDFIRWIVIISAMGMASTAFGGPRGAVGAPAGAMNVVNSFPKGVNEK